MSLGFSFGAAGSGGGGGDFLAYVKYDARAGRMKRVDRSQATGTWLTEEVDITRNFKACFDLENVEVGWINFQTGGPPAFLLVPYGQSFPAKPGEGQWKQGVRLMLMLGQSCAVEPGAADVREISSNAEAFLRGVDELHTEFLKLKAEHKKGTRPEVNYLPVVVLVDTKAITSPANSEGKSSTNYQPIFQIESWVPRPAALVFKPKASTIGLSSSAPASSAPSGQSSPPVPASPPGAPAASSLPPWEGENGYAPLKRPPQTGGTIVGAPAGTILGPVPKGTDTVVTASADDFG